MTIEEIFIRWAPWIITGVLGSILALVNTKMENLRDRVGMQAKEVSTLAECNRHNEVTVADLRKELERWKIDTATANERHGGLISRIQGSVEHLIQAMRDMSSDIKGLSPRVSILETRVGNVESRGTSERNHG